MQTQFLGCSLILAMTLVGWNSLLAQSPEEPPDSSLTADAPQLVLPCGRSSGVRFNLEPRVDPLPQNGTAVDFLPGAGVSGADLIVGAANDMRMLTAGSGTAPDFRGVFGISSQTGFYVHRDGMDLNPCSPDLEGGLSPVASTATGKPMVGVGYPAVASYPPGQAFYIADTRVSEGEGGETAIGIFRSRAATLNNSAICPAGTLSQTESSHCWPNHALVNLGSTFALFNASPHLAVDERPAGSGAGAGNVYISATQTGQINGNSISQIIIVACKNDLSACSPAAVVSGPDYADLSHVAVRPDGGVTATYTIQTGGLTPTPTRVDIKYVACQPGAPPAPVSCSPATLITSEMQAIPFSAFNPQGPLESNRFVLHTFPKHAHRQDSNGIETYVVWDRCKVSTAIPYPGVTFVNKCVDADILMAASNDNGQTWHFAPLDISSQDQFQPWITTDRTTNTLQIGYYTSANDTAFQHRALVALRQIPPGSLTPDVPTAAQIVTSVALEPNGDPVLQGIFIGHYLGVAARSSAAGGARVYVHYTHTSVPGIYNGVSDPEQNNHLSRIDF
jgi:hypothetical protein